MEWRVFLLFPFKDNQIYAENVIVVYKEQPKVNFCEDMGVLLEIAFGPTMVPLRHCDSWTFIIILFGTEGYDQLDYNIFLMSTLMRRVRLCKIDLRARLGRQLGR